MARWAAAAFAATAASILAVARARASRRAPSAGLLPIINVKAFLAGEPGALEKLAAELHDACAGIGFYYMEGFDEILPASLCARMLDAARDAHAAPDAVKEQWLLDDADSGYMPQGATTRWGSLGRPQLPIHDGKNEAVLLWGHGPPWSARSIGEFEENQMPPEAALPGWAETVAEYYRAVRTLATELMPVYARALRVDKTHFDGQFDRPCWCIRLNHYPPPDGSGAALGIPPHADGDFTTFLLTDDQPGLSLQRADGEWVHLKEPPRAGAPHSMLVNSGNSLQRLSNGAFPSTMHTASCYRPGKPRFSVPFFWSPSVDAVIEPLAPWVTADCPSRYEARSSGKVESSGKVGFKIVDPLRKDARADTFDIAAAAHAMA